MTLPRGLVDDLVHRERLVIQTYELILARLGNALWGGPLKTMVGEHRDAVQLLDGRLGDPRYLDVKPLTREEKDQLISAVAALPAEDPAGLKMLREKEKRLLDDYERALFASNLNPGARDIIRSAMVPLQRRRIEALDRLVSDSTRAA